MSLLPALTVKVFVNVLLVEVEVEAIGAPFVSTVGCPFLGFGMSIPVNSIHKETGIPPVSRLLVQHVGVQTTCVGVLEPEQVLLGLDTSRSPCLELQNP